MAKPDWLPDWKAASQYRKLDTLGLGEWAWQFLRRNRDYRAAFADFRSRMASRPWNIIGYPEIEDAPELWEVGASAPRHGPWRSLPDGRFAWPLYRSILHRFGLSSIRATNWRSPSREFLPICLVDPAVTSATVLLLDDLHLRSSNHPMATENCFEVRVPPWTVIWSFRLEDPIDPQIEFAKALLSTYAKDFKLAGELKVRAPRSRRNLYARYLRLLDAEESGATFADMARELFPRELAGPGGRDGVIKRVSAALRAARKLRDSGYKLLPIMPPAAGKK